MSEQTYPDPFTAAHQAIWMALLALDAWTAIVKENGRINMGVDIYRKPKPEAGVGQLPEFMVSQTGLNCPPIRGNTETAKVTQDYTLLVTSDRINWTVLNQIKYLTFVALWKAGASLGKGCLIDSWQLTGSDAQSASSGDPTQPALEYRASFIGRVTVTFNLNKQAVVNPATTY